jgi:hypothetical protein
MDGLSRQAYISENYKLLRNVRNVIIEGAPHENKMVGKGQITSERASSQKMIRL